MIGWRGEAPMGRGTWATSLWCTFFLGENNHKSCGSPGSDGTMSNRPSRNKGVCGWGVRCPFALAFREEQKNRKRVCACVHSRVKGKCNSKPVRKKRGFPRSSYSGCHSERSWRTPAKCRCLAPGSLQPEAELVSVFRGGVRCLFLQSRTAD